jgi:hypothetical protein
MLYSVVKIIHMFQTVMSKFSSKYWFNSLKNPLAATFCLAAVVVSLVVINRTVVISSAALITLLINTLRILFFAYLMYSVVQIFKPSSKGKDKAISDVHSRWSKGDEVDP